MEKSAISRLAELFVLLDRERYNPTFVNNTTEFTDEELKEVRNFFINNLKENAVEIVDHLITSCNGPIAKKYHIENKLNFLINSLLTSYQQMLTATQGAQGYGHMPIQQMPMPANQGAQACAPVPNCSALVSMCDDFKNEVRYGIADPYNKLTKSKDELRKAFCNIQGRVTIVRYYVPDYIKESDNIVCLVESNDFQERNKQQEFMCMVNGLVEGIKEYSNEYNCNTVLDFRSHMSPDDNEKLRDVITNCMKHLFAGIFKNNKLSHSECGICRFINLSKETFEKKLKEAFEKTHRMNPSEFVTPRDLRENRNVLIHDVDNNVTVKNHDTEHPEPLERGVFTFLTRANPEDTYVPEVVPLYPGRVAVINEDDAFVIEE